MLQNQPRYQRLADSGFSHQDLIDAGLIQQPDILIEGTYPDINDGVVLLLTGCFAPIHEGHIESMAVAKNYFEERGIKITGGLFGFCNDEYVRTKTNEWDFQRRKQYFDNHPLKEQWMHVFEYEAIQSGALNFTTVFDKAKQLYKNVIMICGSDNYKFVYTFDSTETVVVFNRDNKPIDKELSSNCIILNSPHSHQSSSRIRNAVRNS